MIAAVWDTPYNLVYVVHMLSVIVGTGMAVLAPVMAVRARREAGRPVQEFVDDVAAAVVFPSFLVAGMAGGALVGLSDDFYDFGQTWLAIGGVVWIIAVAAAALAYPPSYVPVPDMVQHRSMLTGVLHLSLAVMLILMTWKWGV